MHGVVIAPVYIAGGYVQAIDPNISTVFYYNSVLDWPFYKMHEEFVKHPDYWVRTLDPYGFRL
jgi:hypothetical protein